MHDFAVNDYQFIIIQNHYFGFIIIFSNHLTIIGFLSLYFINIFMLNKNANF